MWNINLRQYKRYWSEGSNWETEDCEWAKHLAAICISNEIKQSSYCLNGHTIRIGPNIGHSIDNTALNITQHKVQTEATALARNDSTETRIFLFMRWCDAMRHIIQSTYHNSHRCRTAFVVDNCWAFLLPDVVRGLRSPVVLEKAQHFYY